MAAKNPPSVDTPYSTTTITTTTNARQISTVVDVSSTTSTASASAKKISTVVDTPYTTTVSSPNISNVAVTLANTTASTADTSTAADSYYASGVGGLNNLVESGRVFRGANVYVTLEEQRYITNNTTVTGDGGNGTPGGSNTQIQFNDSSAFGGDSGLTYNKTTNVLAVAGNITSSYVFGNGSQLTGIVATTTYGNSNVVSLLSAFGSNTISTTGNVTGNYFIGNGSQLTGLTATYGNSNVTTLLASLGSNTISGTGNITTTANISGGNILGNGRQLTGIVSSYGNANVVANLAALGSNPISSTGNITAGNLITSGLLSVTGNITGNYFIGNGSQLTGISASLPLSNGTSNINIVTVNGNVTVTSSGNTWTFGTDSKLTVPAATGVPGRISAQTAANGRGYDLRISAGNTDGCSIAGGDMYLSAGAGYGGVAWNAGNVNIVTGDRYSNPTGNTWRFDALGNLNLPGNTFAVNYANGGLVTFTANTGNVTFSGEAVIGTGTSNTVSGLYLAPDLVSLANNLFLRVRGNIQDEPTHIHFDTGNNQYYNLFIGDDNKYIQLANTGNIVINANNNLGNSAQWTFGTDGTLSAPGNISAINLVINSIRSDDSTFVTIEDGVNISSGAISSPENLSLTAGGNTWTFRNDGIGIVLPNSAIIRDTNIGALAIGYQAGFLTQGTGALAVGYQAALYSQGANAVAIGFRSGGYSNVQGTHAVAVGAAAGQDGQGAYAVAVGPNAGNTSQGSQAVAIGRQAGESTQGADAVAVGQGAGYQGQGLQAVAIGATAGVVNQGVYSVAIGAAAGAAGNSAVAIGVSSGFSNQGNFAVAIGASAGGTNQGNNSIILNATGAVLDQTTANTFTVAPVRNDVANVAQVMFYNATSKEITYGNVISVAGNVTAGNLVTGGLLSVTGNANVGNLGTAGLIVATGNITGGNLTTGGLTSTASLNITGNTATVTTANYSIGYLNIPQVSLASNTTTALTDSGKHYYSVSASNLALTIANNTSVSWTIGTAISIVNRGTANITIAGGTGVSLYLAGNSSAGNRVVTTYGMATVMNVAANIWMINGTVV